MSGLQRGTPDYRVILSRFQNNEYNRTSYNSEAIRTSNSEWSRKYNPVAFAESLRHIVATLYLAPPPPIPLNPSGAVPAEHPDTMNRETWGSPPPADANQEPAGSTMLDDNIPLLLPKQVVAWSDTTENQNDRLTCYIHMPPGHPKENFEVRVNSGGMSATILYKWPEEMLSDVILKRMGYEQGHNKLIAFGKHVQKLRGGHSDQPVVSHFRIALPFAVEEQLTNVQVPRPIYTTTLPKGLRVLAIEMMGIRSNYQARRVEAEYDSPPRHTAAASVPDWGFGSHFGETCYTAA